MLQFNVSGTLLRYGSSGVSRSERESMSINAAKENTSYCASLTREQFCFYEMRTTAKLVSDGLSDAAVMQQIMEGNLFQYPTERSVKRIASMCLTRLRAMADDTLISAIASQPVDVAKQICLYAMMKDSRLLRDFMVTVIGEKYRTQDFTFSKRDVHAFFTRLQEQNDTVAGWSFNTVTRIQQILIRVLVENDYLDDRKSEKLNPVLIGRTLEHAIHANGDAALLPAFNCFG